MSDQAEKLSIEVSSGLSTVSAEQWDACAGGDNPFISYAFLSALEESGSVAREEGWLPQHLLVKDANGCLLGAAPAYLKSHSQGEYIFDHAWADALERAGGRYYPKFLSAVPFTPVTGPRLLVSERNGTAAKSFVQKALASGMMELASQMELSSVHINFVEEDLVEELTPLGFLERWGEQFHWFNQGYESFEDFLSELSSRKRKAIKKERRSVAETEVKLSAVTGDDLTVSHWDAFFEFYTSTSDRKWGWPYLTREFFDILHQTMRDKCVLIVGEYGGEFVCGALNLRGSDCLYGRNWGCTQNAKFLHFEACYYQALDFAIEQRLARVEAGAQGYHKLQRGYLPTKTRSLHWIREQGFSDAIENYLGQEKRAVQQQLDALMEESPFKKENG